LVIDIQIVFGKILTVFILLSAYS